MTATTGSPPLHTHNRYRRRTIITVLAAVVLAASTASAYALGTTQPRPTLHTGTCLSALGTISCEAEDGHHYRVPRDVAWDDHRGTYHPDGRPACLPPTGIGAEGPIRFATLTTTVGDRDLTTTVWVGCN